MNNKISSLKCHYGPWRYMLVVAASFLIFLSGCNNSSENIPDISNININLHTSRFDKDLYAIDTNHIGEGLQKLYARYPDFLNYFLDTLMAYGIRGNYSDTSQGIRELDTFLTYKDYVDLEDTIKKKYPGNKDIDKELTDGFRFMKYYLPGYTAPRIIYLNMGLSKWSSFPVDTTTLCVGLDMFLGDGFPHYKDVGIPSYMDAHFRRTYLPVSVFSTVYQTMHPFVSDDKTLLDLMVQRGKEQYFLHKILPYTPDSVLFGFTQVQLNWCGQNEGLVYNFFIHQQLLYNKEGHYITPYVYDGPFAKDLESPSDPVKVTPGNIGTWLGYRIVCGYMAEHSGVSLQELLAGHNDATKLLEEARYRPK